MKLAIFPNSLGPLGITNVLVGKQSVIPEFEAKTDGAEVQPLDET